MLKNNFIHRRRDYLGRFLPCDNQEEPFNDFHPKLEEPQRENNIEEPFENPFANIQDELPPSLDESFNLNEIFSKPKYQDNPLAIVIYQELPLLPTMVVPTFPFPIPL